MNKILFIALAVIGFFIRFSGHKFLIPATLIGREEFPLKEDNKEDATIDTITVATWNIANWADITATSTGNRSEIPTASYQDYADAAKALLEECGNPNIIGVQEYETCFDAGGTITTDEAVFDGYEDKIHPCPYPRGENSTSDWTYNAIYSRGINIDTSVVSTDSPVARISEKAGHVVHWVLTEATINGQKVAILCTHLNATHTEDIDRKRMQDMQAIIEAVKDYDPVIIFSDSNIQPDCQMLDPDSLASDTQYKYALGLQSAGFSSADGKTIYGGSGSCHYKVDNIYVRGFDIIHVGYAGEKISGRYGKNGIILSDHQPIFATLIFK